MDEIYERKLDNGLHMLTHGTPIMPGGPEKTYITDGECRRLSEEYSVLSPSQIDSNRLDHDPILRRIYRVCSVTGQIAGTEKAEFLWGPGDKDRYEKALQDGDLREINGRFKRAFNNLFSGYFTDAAFPTKQALDKLVELGFMDLVE